MTATMLALTDDVVAALNDESRSWSLPFVAVRQNVPRIDRDKAGSLSVIVTNKTRQRDPLTRGAKRETHQILIGIQQQLPDDSNEHTDALVLLGEEIADFFDDNYQSPTDHFVCVSVQFGSNDQTPWLSVRDQSELLLYTGVVALTFVGTR